MHHFDFRTHTYQDHITPVPKMQIGKNDKKTKVNKWSMFGSLACSTDHRKRQTVPHSHQQRLNNGSFWVQTCLKYNMFPKPFKKKTIQGGTNTRKEVMSHSAQRLFLSQRPFCRDHLQSSGIVPKRHWSVYPTMT